MVGAGELAGGLGAAHVERVVAAEVGEVGGASGDGCVEVEGVGQIEDAGEVDESVDAALVEVEGEVAVLGGGLAAAFGFLGVVAGRGLRR